ncbi:MAG: hypothetical protein QMC06_05150 [Gammaproteobacteria bacterium]|jgi:uncharacterized lipoprotein YajG
MKDQTSKRVIQAVVSLISVFLLAGCSTNSDDFPLIANPAPFDYVDGEITLKYAPTSLRIAATR